MQRATHKIICTLLSLLLIMGGQLVVSAENMPVAEDSPAMTQAMTGCGHHPDSARPGSGQTDSDQEHSADQTVCPTEAMSASPGCGDAENMACLSSAGSGQCLMTMVLAHAPAFSFAEALSHPVVPGQLFSYRNPFLDVLTPPPDLLS